MERLRNAERVFGQTVGHVTPNNVPDEHDLHERLCTLVADHRVMLDRNVDVAQSSPGVLEVTIDRRTRRRAAMKTGPLPLCERWGDEQARAYVSPQARTAHCDVLGHDSKLSLPVATHIAATGKRVGPGGTMRADLESAWVPVQSYAAIATTHTFPHMAFMEPPNDKNATEADVIATCMDGDRMWPPRCLSSVEDSEHVAALVGSICDAVSASPERVRKTNAGGVYQAICHQIMSVDGKFAKGFDVGDLSKRDLATLGVCVFMRNSYALRSARKHAMHGSMAAYLRGCDKLGDQLERLGRALNDLVGL